METKGSNEIHSPGAIAVVASGGSQDMQEAMQAQEDKISVDDVCSNLKGFEKIKVVHGSTYKDCSTILVVPTRGEPHTPTLSARFVGSLQSLIAPMNQPRAILFACGHEVGKAYNALVDSVLKEPGLAKFKYIMTVEDDNLVPCDAHIRLLESIEEHNLDAVSGLYFTKGEVSMPMAFGDAEESRRTGVFKFAPRDVRSLIEKGKVAEVNGIAMGCALWRIQLFRDVPGPWFVTNPEEKLGEITQMTQDLDFCLKARRAGKRFGVDCRVKVGHIDMRTGEVY